MKTLLPILILFVLAAGLGVVAFTYLREEQDRLNSPNKNTEIDVEFSKEKKVTWISLKSSPAFWILLFILGLIVISIGQSILRKTVQAHTVHNSIIVGGYRQDLTFMSSIELDLQYLYTFSIQKSKKINFDLPQKRLGYYPEFSPDGQWIAFINPVESVSTKPSRIYIIRTDGSQKLFVTIPYEVLQLTWSPDGKQIAYSAYEVGGVYIINVECLLHGGTCIPESHFLVKQPIEHENRLIPSLDWSPDGKQIAYSGTKHISIINVDGQSQAIELTPYFPDKTSQPRWSPDGTKIVGVCNKENMKREPIPNICVMNKDGGNLTYLTNGTVDTQIHYPQWSPNGQKIAYISNFSNENRSVVYITMDSWHHTNAIFIMNDNGSEITHLPLEDNVVIQWYFWHP